MSRPLQSKNINHCSCHTFLLNTPALLQILPSMWQKFEPETWRCTRFHPPSTPSFDVTTLHSTFCTCSQSSRAVSPKYLTFSRHFLTIFIFYPPPPPLDGLKYDINLTADVIFRQSLNILCMYTNVPKVYVIFSPYVFIDNKTYI